MKVQEAALAEVKNLEIELMRMLKNRPSGQVVHPLNQFSMDDVEKCLDADLRKVDELTTQYSLDDTVPLGFKKRVTENIYTAAMKRKEYEWAASFAEKYRL